MGQGATRSRAEPLSEHRDLLDLAVEAAVGAGRVLQQHFERPATGIDTKSSDTDPVSDADRASERFVVDLISSSRPDDGFVAEEGGSEHSSSGVTWVIDPLDGTVNYLYRIPAWCVSIAAQDPKGVMIGVVHDPSRDETFTAVRGGGAQLNGAAISVSKETDLSRALVGTGFSYDAAAREVQAGQASRVLPIARDIRRGGSAALDLVSVACGRLDAFFEAPMEAWDKAAGQLIAEEAGAETSELRAPRVGLSSGLIVGPPALHRQLRDLLLA